MEPLFPAKESVSTKQRILEVSIDLFSQNGYSAVSVREITKAVGIKESALYNHYKTKDALLEAIYEVFRSRTRKSSLPPVDQLDAILAAVTPEQFLMQGFENFKATVSDPWMTKIWRILNIEQYRDARAREIILSDVYGGTIDFLEAAFAKLIAKGEIQPLDPRFLAFEYQYPIFSVMTEYLLLKYDGKDTDDLEKRVEQHIHYFFDQVSNTGKG